MTHLGHRLSGYLDGELPDATAELVAEHLALCDECRSAAAAHARTKGDLRDLGGPAPSAGLMGSLLDMSGSAGPFAPVESPNGYPGLRTADVGRRRLPGAMPLFAAGMAGIAAISVASAVFTSAAPQRVHQVGRTTATGGRARTVPVLAHSAHDTAPSSPAPSASPAPALTGAVRLPLAAIQLVRNPG